MSATRAPAEIEAWFGSLQPQPLAQAIPDPEAAAVFSADMVAGFCSKGALASERVGALARPVAALLRRAYDHGIRDFVLLQDTHDPSTPEFAAFPPHCVRDTDEAATIPEIAGLPFADRFTIVEKNSLHPAIGTGFDGWLAAHPDLRRAIVAGDCTDLCVHALAMHLRLRANAFNLGDFEVIVPADCVDTYDLPPGDLPPGAPGMTHDGDFFHRVFLYHMALNGMRIVASLT